jgi:hypothetical protein
MSCVHVLVMHGELDLRVKLSDPLQIQSIYHGSIRVYFNQGYVNQSILQSGICKSEYTGSVFNYINWKSIFTLFNSYSLELYLHSLYFLTALDVGKDFYV